MPRPGLFFYARLALLCGVILGQVLLRDVDHVGGGSNRTQLANEEVPAPRRVLTSSSPLQYYSTTVITLSQGSALGTSVATFALPSVYVVSFSYKLTTTLTGGSNIYYNLLALSSSTSAAWGTSKRLPMVWCQTGSALQTSYHGNLFSETTSGPSNDISLSTAYAVPSAASAVWCDYSVTINTNLKTMTNILSGSSALCPSTTATTSLSGQTTGQTYTAAYLFYAPYGGPTMSLKDVYIGQSISIPYTLSSAAFSLSGTGGGSVSVVGSTAGNLPEAMFSSLPASYTLSFEYMMTTDLLSSDAATYYVLNLGLEPTAITGASSALPLIWLKAGTALSCSYNGKDFTSSSDTLSFPTSFKVPPAASALYCAMSVSVDTNQLTLSATLSGPSGCPTTSGSVSLTTTTVGKVYSSNAYLVFAPVRTLTMSLRNVLLSSTPTASPTAIPTSASPTAIPTSPSAAPTRLPTATPTRKLRNSAAKYFYTTFHHGPQCASKPLGYEIKPYRLNECLSENGEVYKLTCTLGVNKVTIRKLNYADALCATQTVQSVLLHTDTCGSDTRQGVGAPLTYGLAHCDAVLPSSLSSGRDQVVVESFPVSLGAPAQPMTPESTNGIGYFVVKIYATSDCTGPELFVDVEFWDGKTCLIKTSGQTLLSQSYRASISDRVNRVVTVYNGQTCSGASTATTSEQLAVRAGGATGSALGTCFLDTGTNLYKKASVQFTPPPITGQVFTYFASQDDCLKRRNPTAVKAWPASPGSCSNAGVASGNYVKVLGCDPNTGVVAKNYGTDSTCSAATGTPWGNPFMSPPFNVAYHSACAVVQASTDLDNIHFASVNSCSFNAPYAWGGAGGMPDTMVTFLNQCVEVTENRRLVYHRRVEYVSGDGVSSDLILRETRFTAKDKCGAKGKKPVVSAREIVYRATTTAAAASGSASSSGACRPDPLYPAFCYVAAARTSNVLGAAQMRRLATAVPTMAPSTAVQTALLGVSTWTSFSSLISESRVTLAVKVTTSVAGTITKIMFYKGPGSASTTSHTGAVWSSGGTLLASADFTGETSSGWQTLTLATPVSVAAGSTFLVGYNTSGFEYQNGANAFPSLTVGTFTIVGGFYKYVTGVTEAPTTSFPPDSSTGTNYMVDFVFVPN